MARWNRAKRALRDCEKLSARVLELEKELDQLEQSSIETLVDREWQRRVTNFVAGLIPHMTVGSLRDLTGDRSSSKEELVSQYLEQVREFLS